MIGCLFFFSFLLFLLFQLEFQWRLNRFQLPFDSELELDRWNADLKNFYNFGEISNLDEISNVDEISNFFQFFSNFQFFQFSNFGEIFNFFQFIQFELELELVDRWNADLNDSGIDGIGEIDGIDGIPVNELCRDGDGPCSDRLKSFVTSSKMAGNFQFS